MKEQIYIRLLDEGVEVFRPAFATKLSTNLYEVNKDNNADLEDENWEFPPGSIVSVDERVIEGERVLVAVKQSN